MGTLQQTIRKIKSTKRWNKIVIKTDEYNKEEVFKNKPKVLIVEDNGFSIIPIQTTLKRNHIEYDVAKNGLMAVDRYNQAMKEGYIFSIIL